MSSFSTLASSPLLVFCTWHLGELLGHTEAHRNWWWAYSHIFTLLDHHFRCTSSVLVSLVGGSNWASRNYIIRGRLGWLYVRGLDLWKVTCALEYLLLLTNDSRTPIFKNILVHAPLLVNLVKLKLLLLQDISIFEWIWLAERGSCDLGRQLQQLVARQLLHHVEFRLHCLHPNGNRRIELLARAFARCVSLPMLDFWQIYLLVSSIRRALRPIIGRLGA